MPKTLLRFCCRSRAEFDGPALAAMLNKTNSLPWRGYGAKTCHVTGVDLHGMAGTAAPGVIMMQHRYNQHKGRRVDQTPEGELLDGHGHALGAGQERVVLEWDVYETIDFGQFDIGDLIRE